MIKVPGTPEGIPAIQPTDQRRHQHQRDFAFRARRLRAGGRGYIAGLEARAEGRRHSGSPASRVSSSAASILWSTSKIDDRLENRQTRRRRRCSGAWWKVAIANAKLTYQRTRNFQRPAMEGSCLQRRANAARAVGQHQHEESKLSDVLYVEELIGPDTVNTIPPATFDAFRDHGKPRRRLEENVPAADKPWMPSSAPGSP